MTRRKLKLELSKSMSNWEEEKNDREGYIGKDIKDKKPKNCNFEVDDSKLDRLQKMGVVRLSCDHFCKASNMIIQYCLLI